MVAKNKFPEFKPLKPGEPVEIRLVGKPVSEQLWIDKPKEQAPRTKCYKPSECPACKDYANAKKFFTVPVYGANQIPKVDQPLKEIHVYQGTLLYDAIEARKPQWMVEDGDGWFSLGGLREQSAE